MKCTIDPGFKKKTLTLIDNIVFSTVKDLEGKPLELKMSILLQNGNSEMRLAAGEDDPKEDHSPKPALLWIPGGGWRGTDKNMMLGEMTEFANAGYVVASMYYRSSAQAKWPEQIKDVKTAIRFLRANADKYEIDPDRIREVIGSGRPPGCLGCYEHGYMRRRRMVRVFLPCSGLL